MPGNVNYVKFYRGTVAAFNNLENKNNDTLYFVYESNNADKGKLYLGNKLISGNNGSSEISITDLPEINIGGESLLADKQLLVYNENTGKWENKDLSVLISEMTGATALAAGTSGLVPAPAAGDQEKFLSGDGTWKPVPLHTFNSSNFTLSNNEVSLLGYEDAAIGTIPVKTAQGLSWTAVGSGTLTRAIVSSLSDLEDALEDPNYSGDIALNENTIYMIPNENSTGNNLYNEYMIIGNKVEAIGGFNTSLEGYVTNDIFENRVGNLENIIYDTTDENTGDTIPGLQTSFLNLSTQIGNLEDLQLSEDNTTNTLVEEINIINERLQWQELS